MCTCVQAYMHSCMRLSAHSYIHAYLSTCADFLVRSYIRAFMGSSVPSHIHLYTCITNSIVPPWVVRWCNHSYIRALKRTCVHSCVRTCIRRFICTSVHAFAHSRHWAHPVHSYLRAYIRTCVRIGTEWDRLGRGGEAWSGKLDRSYECMRNECAHACLYERSHAHADLRIYYEVIESRK